MLNVFESLLHIGLGSLPVEEFEGREYGDYDYQAKERGKGVLYAVWLFVRHRLFPKYLSLIEVAANSGRS